MTNTNLSKNRRIAGWVISGLLTTLFLFSASGKFFMPEMATNFANYGIGNWLILIALGEITSTLVFLFPRTNVYGTLLLSSYMGGAIMVHMSHGEPFIFQSAVLILIWVGGFIRNPQLLDNPAT